MSITKQSDVEKVVQDLNETFDGRGTKNLYPSCEERNFKSSDENHLKTCFDCEYVSGVPSSDNGRASAFKSNINKDSSKLEVGDEESNKSERSNYRFYCDVCSFGAAKSQNYRQHMKTKRHLENAELGTNKKVNEAATVTSNISDDNFGLKSEQVSDLESKTKEVENLKTKTHFENADQEINIKVNGASTKSNFNSGLKSKEVVDLNSKKKEELPSIVESKSSMELNATEIENYCNVCDLKANNKYNYDAHLKSKKHFKNLNQNNDTRKNSSDDNNVNDALTSEKAKLIVINHDKKQESNFKVKDNVTTPTVVKLSDKVQVNQPIPTVIKLQETNTPIVTKNVVPETKIENENGLNCPECNKSFGTKSNLNLHMNIHKSVKPFSCLKCQKTFAQKNNLKIHVEKCDSQNPEVPINKTVEKSKTKAQSIYESKSKPELLIKTKSVAQLNEVKTNPVDSSNINTGIKMNTVSKVPMSVKAINDKIQPTETSEAKLATQFHASVKPVTQIEMKTSDQNLDASQNKSKLNITKLNTTINQPQVNNAPKIAKEINPTIPTEKVPKHTLENSKFSKNISSIAPAKKNGFLGNTKLSNISPGNIWGMNKETEWTNMNNVFKSFKADKSNDATPILFKKIEVFEKKPPITEKPFQLFGKNVPQISGSDVPQVFGPKVTPTAQNAKPLQQTEIPLINFDDIEDKDDDEEVELECKDCMEAFWFKYQLHSHFKEVHGVEDPEAYEKRKKSKEMPQFVQKQHQYVQRQKPIIQAYVNDNSNNAMRFVCEVCNLTFNDKRSLSRHLETKKHEDNKFMKNSQKNQKEQHYQNLNTTTKVNPQQLPNVNINTNSNPQNMNRNTRVNLPEAPLIQNKMSAPQQVTAPKRPLPLSNKEREEVTPVRKIAKSNKSESFILVDDEDNDFICKYAGCMETFWYDQQLKDHVAKAHI